MNNADYWARRLKIMEDALKDQSYEYVKNLEQQFDAAIAQIDTQMRAWYQRFADNNGGIGTQLKQSLNESVGLTLSIPIYSRRANKSAVERARIQQKISELDLQNQEKVLLNEIESAWLDASITICWHPDAAALAMRRSRVNGSGVVSRLSPRSAPSSNSTPVRKAGAAAPLRRACSARMLRR